jgi:hypothetical protein
MKQELARQQERLSEKIEFIQNEQTNKLTNMEYEVKKEPIWVTDISAKVSTLEKLQKVAQETEKEVDGHVEGLKRAVEVIKIEADVKKKEMHIRIKAAEDQVSLMSEQVAQIKNSPQLSDRVTLLEERSEVDRKLFEDQQINGQENFILLNGKVDNITKESFDRMNSDKEMKNKIEHLIKDSESYAMSIQMYHQDTEKLSSRQNNFDDILVAVQNKLDKLNERTDGEEKTFNKQIKNEIEEQKLTLEEMKQELARQQERLSEKIEFIQNEQTNKLTNMEYEVKKEPIWVTDISAKVSTLEKLQKVAQETEKEVDGHVEGLKRAVEVIKIEADVKKKEMHIRIKAAEDQVSLMSEQVAQIKNSPQLSDRVTLLEERSEVDRKLFEDQQINGQENFILLNGKVDNITKESFDRMNSDKEMKNKIEHLIKDSESYAMSIQMYHQDTEKLSSRQNNFDDILVAVQNKLDKLNERTDGEEKTFNKQIKNEIEEQK